MQGRTLKKGPDDSLIFFFMGYTNEISLPNVEFHLYNCRSLTFPSFHEKGAVCITLPVCLAGGQEAGPEGKQSRHHHLSSVSPHISMRRVVRLGIARPQKSGHGRLQAAGPPAPAPAQPRALLDGRVPRVRRHHLAVRQTAGAE